MASKLIDLRRAFAGNEDLTDIPDGVIFNNDDDVGDTNIDITETFARTTPVTVENLGFTKINNPVKMASEHLTRENITSSLAYRTVANNGDPDIFENENYNEPGNGSGDSGVGVLPFATKTTRGVVIIGANIDVLNGIISLAPASATKLGLVKAGANITIDPDGTINGVNSYIHPSTHPASIIVQDANNRFVTDAQISTWNGKANTSGTYTGLVVGSANKLTTARNINLTGNVTGTCTFDGSDNVSITCTVVANSHNHLWANITDKPSTFTPSAHNQASNTITAMTGYAKASAHSAIAATDNLNVAIGKLEKALDNKLESTGTYTGLIAGQANQLTTARTFTIGSTGKSFNGTGNVSWTLAEIGAAASEHTHSYLPLSGGQLTGIVRGRAPVIKTALDQLNQDSPSIDCGYVSVPNSGTQYAPMLHGRSHLSGAGYVQHVSLGHKRTASSWGNFYIAVGGNDSYPTKEWLFHGGTGNMVAPGTITATGFVGNLSGTATAANQLATARTFTFTGGATGSGSFNGTGDVSIALTVSGTGHTHSYLPLSGGTLTGEIAGTRSSSWLSGRDSAMLNMTTGDSSYGSWARQRGSTRTFAVGALGNSQVGFYAYLNSRTDNGTDARFYMDGSGNCVASGTINATGDIVAYYSDIRLKRDFVEMTGILDKFTNIKPYYYYQNDVAERLGYEHDERVHIGFIAQEVEKYYPEVIAESAINECAGDSEYLSKLIEDGGKIKTIKYERLVPVLWGAILELNQKIKDLENK